MCVIDKHVLYTIQDGIYVHTNCKYSIIIKLEKWRYSIMWNSMIDFFDSDLALYEARQRILKAQHDTIFDVLFRAIFRKHI